MSAILNWARTKAGEDGPGVELRGEVLRGCVSDCRSLFPNLAVTSPRFPPPLLLSPSTSASTLFLRLAISSRHGLITILSFLIRVSFQDVLFQPHSNTVWRPSRSPSSSLNPRLLLLHPLIRPQPNSHSCCRHPSSSRFFSSNPPQAPHGAHRRIPPFPSA